MKKLFKILTAIALVMFVTATGTQAQGTNFNTTENDGMFGNVNSGGTQKEAVTEAPMYSGGPTGGDVLPVDPWAKARDRSGIETWRGSGQHGRLDYVGEATTYTDAQGQEMIAPEVNRHNMVVGLDHLRNLGYRIPQEYDEKIKNAPNSYKQLLIRNMDEVSNSNDPFSRIVTGMMALFERYTGLDINNLFFNSIRLMGTD